MAGTADMTRPRPGDVVECAMWLSGEETEDHLRRFRDEYAPDAMRRCSDRYLLLLGPLRFLTKKPGEDRVPPVPNSIQGPDVRLLVVEADVLKWRNPPTRGPGFLADLRPEDLQRLRQATRRAHARAHPGMPPLPDVNCDAVVEDMGPEAAVALLRKACGDARLH